MTKSRLKIVFLSPSFFPSIGGVERHLFHISCLLAKHHSVTVVTQKKSDDEKDQEIIEGIQVFRIPPSSTSSQKITVWKWLITHFWLLQQANIIHIHDVFFWILPLYPFVINKKIYITFHGYEAPGPLTKKQIFWHQLAAKLTAGNICVGKFHQKWYGVTPTLITYGATEQITTAKNIDHHSQKALFVGRLDDDTGIESYIKALNLIDKRHEISLDVFGDGPLRQKLQEMVLEQQLHVMFHGWTAKEKIHFENYHLLFSSQYLSILDGLAADLHVVAFVDTPIKKDYLTLTPFAPWISVVYSVKEIALQLITSFVQQEKAVEWAHAQTWESITAQYLQLWGIKTL